MYVRYVCDTVVYYYLCIFMQSLLVMPAGWFMAVKVEVLCGKTHELK